MELTHLVLTVDIWDMNGHRELNLVKQSNASPCISSAATGSFPTTAAQVPPGHQPPQPYDTNRIPGYGHSNATSILTHNPQSNGNGPYPVINQPYQNGSPYSNGVPPYNNNQHGHGSPFQNGMAHFRPTPYPYNDTRYNAPLASPSAYASPAQLVPHQLLPGRFLQLRMLVLDSC